MSSDPTPDSIQTPPEPLQTDDLNEEGEIEKDITVEDTTTVHPLEHTWVFWYNPPNKALPNGDWVSNTKPVVSFSTVEDFWRLYNILKSPANLVVGSNYHVFKDGIEPEWEHPANAKGGKWLLTLPKKSADPQSTKMIDDAWLYTLLAMIGEQLQDSDDITGVVISPRPKETKLAIWTRSSSSTDTGANLLRRIGINWKAAIDCNTEVVFQSHADAMAKGTSYRLRALLKV